MNLIYNRNLLVCMAVSICSLFYESRCLFLCDWISKPVSNSCLFDFPEKLQEKGQREANVQRLQWKLQLHQAQTSLQVLWSGEHRLDHFIGNEGTQGEVWGRRGNSFSVIYLVATLSFCRPSAQSVQRPWTTRPAGFAQSALKQVSAWRTSAWTSRRGKLHPR